MSNNPTVAAIVAAIREDADNYVSASLASSGTPSSHYLERIAEKAVAALAGKKPGNYYFPASDSLAEATAHVEEWKRIKRDGMKPGDVIVCDPMQFLFYIELLESAVRDLDKYREKLGRLTRDNTFLAKENESLRNGIPSADKAYCAKFIENMQAQGQKYTIQPVPPGVNDINVADTAERNEIEANITWESEAQGHDTA